MLLSLIFFLLFLLLSISQSHYHRPTILLLLFTDIIIIHTLSVHIYLSILLIKSKYVLVGSISLSISLSFTHSLIHSHLTATCSPMHIPSILYCFRLLLSLLSLAGFWNGLGFGAGYSGPRDRGAAVYIYNGDKQRAITTRRPRRRRPRGRREDEWV